MDSNEVWLELTRVRVDGRAIGRSGGRSPATLRWMPTRTS